jgi:hypothetical protein
MHSSVLRSFDFTTTPFRPLVWTRFSNCTSCRASDSVGGGAFCCSSVAVLSAVGTALCADCFTVAVASVVVTALSTPSSPPSSSCLR